MDEDEDHRGYDLSVVYLDDEDDEGVYVHAHEMIAMLHHEALIAAEHHQEELGSSLLAIADGIAQQTVEVLDMLDMLDDL